MPSPPAPWRLRTAAVLVAMRQSMGQLWTRLAVILGVVALGTAACALIFQWRPVRERFAFGKPDHPGP